jgi:hypothetical protein
MSEQEPSGSDLRALGALVREMQAELRALGIKLNLLARGRERGLATSDTRADIGAHVQNVGDIEGRFGDWIGDRGSGRWIEGFWVTPPQGVAPEELLYRVVLGPNQLSPGQVSGKFCGSEGLAMPLRGFCLTLRGAAAANYECSYTATFVDRSVAGLTPCGRTCAAATFTPLEAFQINLRPITTTSTPSAGPTNNAAWATSPTR